MIHTLLYGNSKVFINKKTALNKILRKSSINNNIKKCLLIN